MATATFEIKSAFLFTDFGVQFAQRHFTAEEIAQLGVYGPRSKHAGKPKGKIVWTKVISGGWVRTSRGTASGDAQGYVENRVGAAIRIELHTAEFNQQSECVVQNHKSFLKPGVAKALAEAAA